MAAGLLVLMTLAGCGGWGGSTSDSKTSNAPATENAALCDIFMKHYLWDQLIPSNVDPAAFPTAEKLLTHLTAQAKAAGKDRWSEVEPRSGARASVSMGELASAWSWGFRIAKQGENQYVTEVIPGSAAAQAGLKRGDQVLAAASTRASLDRLKTLDPAVGRVVLLALWSKSQGPQASERTAWFHFKKAQGGATFDAELQLAHRPLDLVPQAHAPRILDGGAGHKVGYLELKRFDDAADAPLREAMGHFKQAQVTDLIVDLRYNPGGDFDTVKVLTNLLRAQSTPGEVMFRNRFRSGIPDELVYFKSEPTAIQPNRIAFIVSGASASGSEAVANALAPYFKGNLALVGQRTDGKPVASRIFPLPFGNNQLRLTVFQVLNSEGHADYFQGVPYAEFRGVSCAAEDDLGHAPGDPAEGSTKAALRWITDGTSAQGPIR
jgi:C-terminal processing protease CtpA/Prc